MSSTELFYERAKKASASASTFSDMLNDKDTPKTPLEMLTLFNLQETAELHATIAGFFGDIHTLISEGLEIFGTSGNSDVNLTVRSTDDNGSTLKGELPLPDQVCPGVIDTDLGDYTSDKSPSEGPDSRAYWHREVDPTNDTTR